MTSQSLLGAPKQVSDAENSLEVEEHAKFAVDEHNRQHPDAKLFYKKVVSAKTQPVAGTMFHLSIEAHSEQHGTGVYEAKVWTKAWEGFKKLEDFKPSSEAGGKCGGSCASR